ncbi:MAG: DUF1016 N-terminal domain-containing protein [Saprospiraceae bacterium]
MRPSLLKKVQHFFTRFPNWSERLLLLSWSHYLQLLSLKGDNICSFYFREALLGQWANNRQLKRQIKTNIWARTVAASTKKTPVQIRAPYTFEFIPATTTPPITGKGIRGIINSIFA